MQLLSCHNLSQPWNLSGHRLRSRSESKCTSESWWWVLGHRHYSKTPLLSREPILEFSWARQLAEFPPSSDSLSKSFSFFVMCIFVAQVRLKHYHICRTTYLTFGCTRMTVWVILQKISGRVAPPLPLNTHGWSDKVVKIKHDRHGWLRGKNVRNACVSVEKTQF